MQPPLRDFGFALAPAPLAAAMSAWFLYALFLILRAVGAQELPVYEYFFLPVILLGFTSHLALLAVPIAYAAAAFVSLPFLVLARFATLRLWHVLLLSAATGFVAVVLFLDPWVREPHETSVDILLMSILIGAIPGAVFGASFWLLLHRRRSR